jgi:deoxyribodipyrimidine photo-lyase
VAFHRRTKAAPSALTPAPLSPINRTAVPPPVLVWFRDDHRLSDNPALAAAVATGRPVLCFHLLDESSTGFRPLGAASRWWLHGSLDALDRSLRERGSELALFRGAAEDVVPRLAAATGAERLFFSRRYLAAEIAVDRRVAEALRADDVAVESFNGRLLHEPGSVLTKTGSPYRVFTPYLKAALAKPEPGEPVPPPPALNGPPWPDVAGRAALADLDLLPTKPDWAGGMREAWRPGEAGAAERLRIFLREGLKGYGTRRNLPGVAGTTRLSPHLRFGEIGPRQVMHAATAAFREARNALPREDLDKIGSEIAWRDFCYGLLHDIPDLPSAPFRKRFEAFPFRDDPVRIRAWRRGRTGYPIVDAGIRQLWTTGWMHNRVRMIAGSFLVKHLLVDWRVGEEWFWDTLVDADPANNAFSWQWIAGSGPDSAPFHRIFNPVTQAEKFDPDGGYVRSFLPELAQLPARFIHRPWDAPPAVLRAAGVELGENYPQPIVRHETARAEALGALRTALGAAA